MSQYTLGTVRRAVSIVANTDRSVLDAVLAEMDTPKPAPKPVAKPQPRRSATIAKPKNDWRTRPASAAQVNRIHVMERTLGYKLSTRKAIGNAGQASDLYQSLKAEAR